MLRDLRQQKLRTFLTLMGITCGTIAVSRLIAFGEGVHKKTAKDIRGMGDHIVIAWPGQTTKPFEGLPKGRRVRVTQTDIDALERAIPEGRFAGEYHQR